MIPGSLSLENVGLRGTQVINFCKIFLLKSSPQKPNFSSGTLIMCTGVQCIRVGIQKCPGYVRILVKKIDHLFPELKARKKQVFNGGGDDEQGAPRLHAHPCPRMHSLYNTQVVKSSKCFHKTKSINTSISILNHRNTLGLDHQYETFSPDERQPSW